MNDDLPGADKLSAIPEDVRKRLGYGFSLAELSAPASGVDSLRELAKRSVEPTKETIAAAALDELTGRKAVRDLERQLQQESAALRDTLTREPLVYVDPDPGRHERRARQQREAEELALLQRTAAATEQALADSRLREQRLSAEGAASQSDAQAARAGERRWKIITACISLAGLAIAAWSQIKDRF